MAISNALSRITGLFLACLLLAACGGDKSGVREDAATGKSSRLLITGSSTVAPFVTSVAEYFGATTAYGTPIVEATGTGGGFGLFCRGEGAETPSITMASRRIKPGEKELCARNGVADIIELDFGYDGIVLIHANQAKDVSLTREDIYLALAKTLIINGKSQANPHRYWSDVNPALPDERIEVFGPPPTSGTRDAFVSLVMQAGACKQKNMSALEASNPEQFEILSSTIRTDGVWVDAGENDAQTVLSLTRNKAAFGVVGFSYLDRNTDRIKAVSIDGVMPDYANIKSSDYAVARALYLYVKGGHLRTNSSLVPFIEAVYDETAMGEGGYLKSKGLIPLTNVKRAAAIKQFHRIARRAGDELAQAADTAY